MRSGQVKPNSRSPKPRERGSGRSVSKLKLGIVATAAVAGSWYASLPWVQGRALKAADVAYSRQVKINDAVARMNALHQEYLPYNAALAEASRSDIKRYYGLTDGHYDALKGVALKLGLPIGRVPDTLAMYLTDAGSEREEIKIALEKGREEAGDLLSTGKPETIGGEKLEVESLKRTLICDAFSRAINDPDVLDAVQRVQQKATVLFNQPRSGEGGSYPFTYFRDNGVGVKLHARFSHFGLVRDPQILGELQRANANEVRANDLYSNLNDAHRVVRAQTAVQSDNLRSVAKWEFILPPWKRGDVDAIVRKTQTLKAKAVFKPPSFQRNVPSSKPGKGGR